MRSLSGHLSISDGRDRAKDIGLSLGTLEFIEPSRNSRNKSALRQGGVGNHGIQVRRESAQQIGPA
jgi:hypothetical protein